MFSNMAFVSCTELIFSAVRYSNIITCLAGTLLKPRLRVARPKEVDLRLEKR